MVFSDFTYPEVFQELGLTLENIDDLFAGVAKVAPGESLRQFLPQTVQLASVISTEKARSEWMVAPVLADF